MPIIIDKLDLLNGVVCMCPKNKRPLISKAEQPKYKDLCKQGTVQVRRHVSEATWGNPFSTDGEVASLNSIVAKDRCK